MLILIDHHIIFLICSFIDLGIFI